MDPLDYYFKNRKSDEMMKEVIIPNGSVAVEAEYKEQIIPDYRGNPFIEHFQIFFHHKM